MHQKKKPSLQIIYEYKGKISEKRFGTSADAKDFINAFPCWGATAVATVINGHPTWIDGQYTSEQVRELAEALEKSAETTLWKKGVQKIFHLLADSGVKPFRQLVLNVKP